MNRKITELLDHPSKWSQGSYARLADGSHALGNLLEATMWCLTAAIDMCYGSQSEPIRAKVSKAINMDSEHIHLWNDAPERTYEDVIKLCKKLKI